MMDDFKNDTESKYPDTVVHLPYPAGRESSREQPAAALSLAAPSGHNLLVFPTGEKWDSISAAERLLFILAESGFHPSSRLKALLKIQPWERGRHERYEFFDCASSPPEPYTYADAPLRCYHCGRCAPAWIRKWYLCMKEEAEGWVLLLIYTPKSVFIVCRLEEAEEVVPAVMQRNTIRPERCTGRRPIPPCPLDDD